MAVALGILGWTPETFWRASLLEYAAAVRGKRIANGAAIESNSGGRLNSPEMRKLQEELDKAPDVVESINGSRHHSDPASRH